MGLGGVLLNTLCISYGHILGKVSVSLLIVLKVTFYTDLFRTKIAF
jgi:hypothetical protein